MKLLSWFRSPPALSPSKDIILRALAAFDLPTLEVEPGTWSVTAEAQGTYRVSLYFWAQDDAIVCMASGGVSVERDLLPRELLLQLLEENNRGEVGAFRLVPRDEQRIVTVATTVDARRIQSQELKMLGETLIERMQRAICKLHRMGLIIDGPVRTSTPDDEPPGDE